MALFYYRRTAGVTFCPSLMRRDEPARIEPMPGGVESFCRRFKDGKMTAIGNFDITRMDQGLRKPQSLARIRQLVLLPPQHERRTGDFTEPQAHIASPRHRVRLARHELGSLAAHHSQRAVAGLRGMRS